MWLLKRLFVTSPRGESHRVLSGQQYLSIVSSAARSTLGFAPAGFPLLSAADRSQDADRAAGEAKAGRINKSKFNKAPQERNIRNNKSKYQMSSIGA